jgi:hypothetical protein
MWPSIGWIKVLFRAHFSLGIPVKDVYSFQIFALILMD